MRTRIKKNAVWVLFTITLLVLLAFAMRYTALLMFEKKGLPAKVSSNAVPGVPYRRLQIINHTRTLDAFWVAVPDENAPAVLIFHGIGETIPLWIHVQELLYHQGISTMVFDYSGAGKSSGTATVANLNSDALAVYNTLKQKVNSTSKIYFLGFSMGSGMAMQTAVNAAPKPSGIILCEPLSSLQEAAVATGTPEIFAYALPGIWNNVHNALLIHFPALIIHSDSDHVFSLAMSQAIYNNLPAERTLSLVHGFSHTALYKNPNMTYWSPIINFVDKSH